MKVVPVAVNFTDNQFFAKIFLKLFFRLGVTVGVTTCIVFHFDDEVVDGALLCVILLEIGSTLLKASAFFSLTRLPALIFLLPRSDEKD